MLPACHRILPLQARKRVERERRLARERERGIDLAESLSLAAGSSASHAAASSAASSAAALDCAEGAAVEGVAVEDAAVEDAAVEDAAVEDAAVEDAAVESTRALATEAVGSAPPPPPPLIELSVIEQVKAEFLASAPYRRYRKTPTPRGGVRTQPTSARRQQLREMERERKV